MDLPMDEWVDSNILHCSHKIRISGHSAYRTEHCIVWAPKYHHRILNPGLQGYLFEKTFS